MLNILFKTTVEWIENYSWYRKTTPLVLQMKVPDFEDTIIYNNEEHKVRMENFTLLSKLVAADDEASLAVLRTLQLQHKILPALMLYSRDIGSVIRKTSDKDWMLTNPDAILLAIYKRNEKKLEFVLQAPSGRVPDDYTEMKLSGRAMTEEEWNERHNVWCKNYFNKQAKMDLFPKIFHKNN